jgi:uncharacterized protein
MIELGKVIKLKVLMLTTIGAYLDDGGPDGILLPKRYCPRDIKIDDELEVFVYQDNENRLIATTHLPIGVVDDIVCLKVASITDHGVFLDNGIDKDLFIPMSQLLGPVQEDEYCLVKIYIDKKSGRITASERLDSFLSNQNLTVAVKEEVRLIAYRQTDIGFTMIVNEQHFGVLHNNETFKKIEIGDIFSGFVKAINEDNKIDVLIGKPGYKKIEDESSVIIRELEKRNGHLPFNDKTNADLIYEMFGMSKRTFKMIIGRLYRDKIIEISEKGIKLL